MSRRTNLAAATLLAALASQPALFPAGLQPSLPLNPTTPPAAGSRFGSALAVGHGVVAVGAYLSGVGGPESGAVYLFRGDEAGNWQQVQPTLQGSPGDWFGFDVAIDGATLLVGAPMASNGTGARTGAAYSFDLTDILAGRGSVGPRTTLPIPGGQDGDQIGSAVAASGGAWAVGARGDSQAGAGAGSVYVYRAMGQVEKLVPDAPADGAELGQSVALDMSSGRWRLAAGAPLAASGGQPVGAAYIYESAAAAPAAWQRTILPGTQPDDAFGYAVALSGDKIVVGAPLDASLGTDAGAAFLYSRQASGTWQLLQPLAGAAKGAQFGVAVGFDRAERPGADQIVIGARLANGGVGAAYLFDSGGGQVLALPRPQQVPTGGELGFETAIHGGTVVVGAFLQDAGAGAAYLFAPAVSPPGPQVVTVSLASPPLASPASAGMAFPESAGMAFPESAGQVSLAMPISVSTSDGQPTRAPVTVELEAVAGALVAGGNFRLLTHRVALEIPLGQPQGPVKVPAVFAFAPDPPCFGDETFTVNLLPMQQPGVVRGKPASEPMTLHDDLPGLAMVLAHPPELLTADDGTADHFTVALCSRPSAPVTVGFTGAIGRATLSPPSLSFTSANWSQPQAVAVSGVDAPGCVVGPPTHYAIAVATASADRRYAALSPPVAPVDSLRVAFAHVHRALIGTDLTVTPSCDGTVLYTLVMANLGECLLEEAPTTQLSFLLPWNDLSLVTASTSLGTATADLVANQVSWSGALPAFGHGAPYTPEQVIGLAELQPGAILGELVVVQAVLSYASHPGGPADTTVVTNPASFTIFPAGCPSVP